MSEGPRLMNYRRPLSGQRGTGAELSVCLGQRSPAALNPLQSRRGYGFGVDARRYLCGATVLGSDGTFCLRPVTCFCDMLCGVALYQWKE